MNIIKFNAHISPHLFPVEKLDQKYKTYQFGFLERAFNEDKSLSPCYSTVNICISDSNSEGLQVIALLNFIMKYFNCGPQLKYCGMCCKVEISPYWNISNIIRWCCANKSAFVLDWFENYKPELIDSNIINGMSSMRRLNTFSGFREPMTPYPKHPLSYSITITPEDIDMALMCSCVRVLNWGARHKPRIVPTQIYVTDALYMETDPEIFEFLATTKDSEGVYYIDIQDICELVLERKSTIILNWAISKNHIRADSTIHNIHRLEIGI
ncbi:MAG: hypothetical protein JKX76_02685 [Colwellia sp.]|nr:hypothetical protein [Colwellia sp.]